MNVVVDATATDIFAAVALLGVTVTHIELVSAAAVLIVIVAVLVPLAIDDAIPCFVVSVAVPPFHVT